MRIGIVAGEASGDILGASLIEALQARHENIIFDGIGGPLMCGRGFNSLFPMERLSVMGLVEPLKRLPELLRIRRSLREHFLQTRPDLVLGIDSPDFNLDLELALRKAGIKTAHYVSPSVWAWRQGRIKKISRAVDHMLTLFPFEEAFYREHQVPVTFVGHPLADQIPMQSDAAQARRELGLAEEGPLLALLPGSRGSEVEQLAGDFLETARWLLQRQPDLQFVLPAANAERAEQLRRIAASLPENFPLRLLDGQSQRAMAAADAVLMASGTTTLEAMLLKKPMVVCYRFGAASYAILSRLVKSQFMALPNLLAGRELVPERVQDEVCAEVLGPLLLQQLQDSAYRQQLLGEFSALHQQLARNASERAADALLGVIQGGQG